MEKAWLTLGGLGKSQERAMVTDKSGTGRWVGAPAPAPALLFYLPRNPPEHGLGGEGGPSLRTWILQRQKI